MPIDEIAAFKEWKQDKGNITLQEAVDSFEDGQTVDAYTAAAVLVLTQLIGQLPPDTQLREITV
ncbi:hypothetical protein LCGC14_0448870 [marine sediment metagenome]|uniref:Uncharacterized protein n=1 Tax=marine sediment metagenome TaxID=412755 RepID=A0A0F9V579_9ZZZZ